MLDVYLVDKNTRLFLAPTQWAFNVRERLARLGHQVEYLGPEPAHDDRSAEELQRRDALLDSTGI